MLKATIFSAFAASAHSLPLLADADLMQSRGENRRLTMDAQHGYGNILLAQNFRGNENRRLAMCPPDNAKPYWFQSPTSYCPTNRSLASASLSLGRQLHSNLRGNENRRLTMEQYSATDSYQFNRNFRDGERKLNYRS